MEKFTVAEKKIPAGYTVKSYDEILADIQENLMKVHEYTCASGVKTGSLVGYSRAFEDLAAGGMIEMKRHGDWVDLTMGPSNPVGRDDPTKRNATLRLDADKVPELR